MDNSTTGRKPLGADVNPSETLRKIANLSKNEEVQHLAMMLASELELQHNAQNNAFQGALGNAELGWANQLDDIVKRLEASEERQTTILEMLETMQEDLRALQQRPPCMHPDLARGQLDERPDDAG